MKRLLLGIIPLGGIAVAVMASRRHRELEPELPEHRTVRLLGHEVEALTNRLRDLATRTPDVQQLISDVEELRADVRRLAGDLTDWQRACLNRDMETSGRVSDMERQTATFSEATEKRLTALQDKVSDLHIELDKPKWPEG